MKQIYLDRVNKTSIKIGDKVRLKCCPYPETCMPVKFKMGINKQGWCSGLIYKCDNMDCIRLCQFYIDGEKRQCYWEQFMTPNEALEVAEDLMVAVQAVFSNTSHYKKHWELLCRRRRSGDRTPAIIT